MSENRQMTPEVETRGQKIARQVVWIALVLVFIGVFASLFINR